MARPPLPVTGIILAGGRGARMGGQDKGLLEFRGRPLIEHVIDILAPQVDELLVNANRNTDAYRRYGYRVIPDGIPDYPGPLAGMLAGLACAAHETVAFAPCDAPALPDDLVQRLLQGMQQAGSPASYAYDGTRGHPVCALLQRGLHPRLAAFLDGGQHKVWHWMQHVGAVAVDFSDRPAAFANLNTLTDLDGPASGGGPRPA